MLRVCACWLKSVLGQSYPNNVVQFQTEISKVWYVRIWVDLHNQWEINFHSVASWPFIQSTESIIKNTQCARENWLWTLNFRDVLMLIHFSKYSVKRKIVILNFQNLQLWSQSMDSCLNKWSSLNFPTKYFNFVENTYLLLSVLSGLVWKYLADTSNIVFVTRVLVRAN